MKNEQRLNRLKEDLKKMEQIREIFEATETIYASAYTDFIIAIQEVEEHIGTMKLDIEKLQRPL